MFGQNSSQLYYDYTLDFNAQIPLQETVTTPAFPPPPLSIPAYNEHDLLSAISSEAYSPMNSSSAKSLFELETSSSFSIDDLQDLTLSQYNQYSNIPLSNESIIIENISRAYPYSPEEKRERIERYRSKKNLRNFNKKIKYECRKTLADSRPRIRGRFARSDEIDKTPQSQWDTTCLEEDDEEEEWIHFLESLSANLIP